MADETKKLICSKCGQSVDAEKLICEHCKGGLVPAVDVPQTFSRQDLELVVDLVARRVDSVRVGEHVLKSLWFWMVFVILFSFVFGGALFALWGHVGNQARDEAQILFHQEMTNQIQRQFQEPRISNIVVSVANGGLTNILIGRNVLPSVNWNVEVSSTTNIIHGWLPITVRGTNYYIPLCR